MTSVALEQTSLPVAGLQEENYVTGVDLSWLLPPAFGWRLLHVSSLG